MTKSKPDLPSTIGAWSRSEGPIIITKKNIFDYMNGAGELYIGYRFHNLDVYKYQAPEQPDILVEIYYMDSPDDAFGLLSLDWGGESLSLDSSASPEILPESLYGEGLLRLRAENIYARILAERETDEAKKTILELGQIISGNRVKSPAPEIFSRLPESFAGGWSLLSDRAGFFRTHLVLNSLYYLGHENMLDLSLENEAVTAPYETALPEGKKKRFQLLLINYPDADRARNALKHFHQEYLPEIPFDMKNVTSDTIFRLYQLEDGWTGYRQKNRELYFLFGCPDEKTIRAAFQKYSSD